jgi:hypothetical protein
MLELKPEMEKMVEEERCRRLKEYLEWYRAGMREGFRWANADRGRTEADFEKMMVMRFAKEEKT